MKNISHLHFSGSPDINQNSRTEPGSRNRFPTASARSQKIIVTVVDGIEVLEIRRHDTELVKPLWRASNGPQVDLQQAYQVECTRWSTRYANEPAYKDRIDRYYTERKQLIKEIDDEDRADQEIDEKGTALGTQLAVAFGLINQAGVWHPELAAGINAGGAEYARASVTGNILQQLPGLARTLALLTAYAVMAIVDATFDDTWPLILLAGIYILYFCAQTGVTQLAPQYISAVQSLGVASQAHVGPAPQPDAPSNKLTLENGKTGVLRSPAFLKSRMKDLKAFLDRGSASEFKKRIDDLEENLAKLRARQAALVVKRKPVEERANSAGYRKSMRLHNKIKELEVEVELYRKWATIQFSKPDDHRSLVSGTRTAIQDEIKSVRRQLVYERAFVSMNKQVSAGNAKNVRNGFNIATAVTGIVGTALSAGLWQNAFAQGVTLTSQIMQVLFYSYLYPKAAAKDYASKLTAQLKVIALTGIGNLAPKNPLTLLPDSTKLLPDPTKLDTLFIGPLKRRVDHFQAVLKFDQSVYLAAIVTLLAREDNVMFGGTYQESVALLQGRKDHAGRLNALDIITETDDEDTQESEKEKVPGWLHNVRDADRIRRAKEILVLYQETEDVIKLLLAGKLNEVVSDDNSKLPSESRIVFRDALNHAAGVTEGQTFIGQYESSDAQLAQWKGMTENRSDLGSINQAAQKLGQTLTLFVAGPSTPLVLKALTSFAQSIIYATVAGGARRYEDLQAIIRWSSIAGNSISITGSCVALIIAYAVHENIATKARHRQRDLSMGAAMPNAGYWTSGTWSKIKPSDFNTLAAKPIDAPPEPIPYSRQANLLGDMMDEIKAPKFKHFWQYLKLQPTVFMVETEEQALAQIERCKADLDAKMKAAMASSQPGSPGKTEAGDGDESEDATKVLHEDDEIIETNPIGSEHVESEEDSSSSKGKSKERPMKVVQPPKRSQVQSRQQRSVDNSSKVTRSDGQHSVDSVFEDADEERGRLLRNSHRQVHKFPSYYNKQEAKGKSRTLIPLTTTVMPKALKQPKPLDAPASIPIISREQKIKLASAIRFRRDIIMRLGASVNERDWGFLDQDRKIWDALADAYEDIHQGLDPAMSEDTLTNCEKLAIALYNKSKNRSLKNNLIEFQVAMAGYRAVEYPNSSSDSDSDSDSLIPRVRGKVSPLDSANE